MLRREDGVTLIELLVVMVILGIVGGIVTTTIVRSLNVTHRAQQRAESLATLQNTLQRVGREVRAADPLRIDEVTDPYNELAIEVRRSGETHVARYYVDTNGDLVEDRDIFDGSGSLTASVTGRLLVNDVQDVTFHYYDDVTPDDDEVDPSDPSTVGDEITCDINDPDSAVRQNCLAALDGTEYIRIVVTTDLLRTQDQNIQTLVSIRNPS